jgi:3-oxoacyl-[acyl-carrier protein] reductase
VTDPYDLTGRVAIVTGGGTGIGAATARLLARRGADVVIASRTVEELERTAAEVQGTTGRRCLAVRTDVKDEEQVARMVQRGSTSSATSTSSSTMRAERAWAR